MLICCASLLTLWELFWYWRPYTTCHNSPGDINTQMPEKCLRRNSSSLNCWFKRPHLENENQNSLTLYSLLPSPLSNSHFPSMIFSFLFTYTILFFHVHLPFFAWHFQNTVIIPPKNVNKTTKMYLWLTITSTQSYLTDPIARTTPCSLGPLLTSTRAATDNSYVHWQLLT